MKRSVMTKLLAILLTLSMLVVLLPAFFSMASETDLTKTSEMPAEWTESNLATGATVIFQTAPHGDANWGWDGTGSTLNDNSLNYVEAHDTNGGFHSNSAIFGVNHSEWVGFDFGEEKTFDTLAVWPCQDAAGSDLCPGMPNAFAVEVSNNNSDWARVYEAYDYSIPTFGPQLINFKEVSARYVRFVALSCNYGVNWAIKLCEIGVYNTDYVPTVTAAPENVALSAATDSNSSHTDGPWKLSNINDGDRYNFNTSGWDYGQFCGYHSSPAHGAGSEVYISFDLGAKKPINQMVIIPGTERYRNPDRSDNFHFPSDYQVRISEDGLTWTSIVNVTGATLTDYQPIVLDFDKIETQYVQFYMPSIPEGYVKISEIELYDTTNPVLPGVDNTVITTPDVNLALGAKVIYATITQNGDWQEGFLNNGIVETNGGFTTNMGSDVQWVGFEFPHPTTLNKLVLYPAYSGDPADTEWSGIPRTFKVQYSNDNMNWETIAFGSAPADATSQTPITVTFETVVAKYIRIWSDDIYGKPSDTGGAKRVQMAEMEAWYEPDKLAASDKFAAYLQEKDSDTAGCKDLRVILVANLKNLSDCAAAEVKITFTLAEGGSKTLVKTLGGTSSDYTLYRSITAGEDRYTAAEGCGIFGNIITGIPVGAYTGITVTVTDIASGTELFTASK